MDKLDLNSFTKEQIEKAMECKTPEELIGLARKYDIEITKEQARSYLDELQDAELTPEALEKVAGGRPGPKCVNYESKFKEPY